MWRKIDVDIYDINERVKWTYPAAGPVHPVHWAGCLSSPRGRVCTSQSALLYLFWACSGPWEGGISLWEWKMCEEGEKKEWKEWEEWTMQQKRGESWHTCRWWRLAACCWWCGLLCILCYLPSSKRGEGDEGEVHDEQCQNEKWNISLDDLFLHLLCLSFHLLIFPPLLNMLMYRAKGWVQIDCVRILKWDTSRGGHALQQVLNVILPHGWLNRHLSALPSILPSSPVPAHSYQGLQWGVSMWHSSRQRSTVPFCVTS